MISNTQQITRTGIQCRAFQNPIHNSTE